MTGTIVRLGWSDPQTGTFGAHPQLGAVLDLNDGQTFTLLTPDGLDLPLPPRTLTLAGNPRTAGERGVRALYRQNRRVRLSLLLGPMASTADLIASVRFLQSWLQAPPQYPVALEYAAPGAAQPVYLDIVGAAYDLPADESAWLRLQLEPLVIELLARPGLRGDRQYVSNLASNPGFEQGSGPGVVVFSDTMATFSAYTVTGGTPSRDIGSSYADIILGDTPLRYYRLDETSGTTADDATGSGNNGTSHNSPTLGQTGLVSGDTDGAWSFASASSQYVSAAATGLPTGSASWSIEGLCKIAANPSGNAALASFGTVGTNTAVLLYLDSTGHAGISVVGTSAVSSASITLNTPHHLVGTFDGATLRMYVDGSLVSTTAASPTIGNGGFWIGAEGTSADFFTGTLDEIAVYGSALTAAQVTSHYNAMHSPPANITTSMLLPSGALATFGDPNWSAINALSLQVRVPSSASTTATIALHRVDANNWLGATLTGGATDGSGTLALIQTIAGMQHTLGSATGLDPNVRYTLTLSQFPTVSGNPASLTASCSPIGTVPVAVSVTGATYDTATALVGQPALGASGGSVGFAGPVSVSEFGPGGWLFQSTGTNLAYGHWSQNTANHYPGGPVTSYGAARIDLNASGGPCDAQWRIYTGASQGAPSATQAIPVRAPGDQFSIIAYVKATGLSATASVFLSITEYDASGSQLRQDSGWSRPSALGNTLTTWTQLAGTYTTNANCAALDLAIRMTEPTASASAGASLFVDNLQVWNLTATGQSAMPYCELRFPQSPAQFVVSGLMGDLPTPALVQAGSYLANWPTGGMLTLALGRRANATANAQLVGPSIGNYAPGGSAPIVPALDATSYGGYSLATLVTSGGWNPRAFSASAADLAGTYHLWARLLTRQSTANLGNVQVRAVTTQQGSPWFGASNPSDTYGTYYGPYAQPFSASNTWALADAGPVTLPPFALGALSDPSTGSLVPRAQWIDTTSGGSTCLTNWQMLLPVDGSLLLATLNNPANAPYAVSGQWLWVYADGLLVNRGSASDAPAWGYSLETSALPNLARAAGGTGTQSTGAINVNFSADPYLTLDPTITVPNGASGPTVGINQLAGVVVDGAGAVLPLTLELLYTPLYLTPR